MIGGASLEAPAVKPGPDPELSLASRAAWLSYIGGLRQEDIAVQLGVSRPKVNRLIALAHKQGMIRIFIDGDVAECVTLGNRLAEIFDLARCEVVPSIGNERLPVHALATGGARFLAHAIQRPDIAVIGIGHGRTLAGMVDRLPVITRADIQIVSLLGGLTRNAKASPFDVIHRLAGRVGGDCYFMPVPFFANSVEDRRVLMAQTSVSDAFERARSAQLCIVGIGEIHDDAYLLRTGMLPQAEYEAVASAGAVGELLGQFVDDAGRPVDLPVNDLAIGLRIDELEGKEVVAVAGGDTKVAAIRAVLRTGVITGLITDEATAHRIVAAEGGPAETLSSADRAGF